jgi:hypothetical protein
MIEEFPQGGFLRFPPLVNLHLTSLWAILWEQPVSGWSVPWPEFWRNKTDNSAAPPPVSAAARAYPSFWNGRDTGEVIRALN